MATRLVKRPPNDPRKAPADPLARLRANAHRPMPVSFAQALSVHLGELKRVNRSRLQRLRNAWRLAIESVSGLNAESASRAEVRNVTRTGAVHVTVSNPALAHELGVVYREALLTRMRELLEGRDSISDLVVRVRHRK
jgi:hypothetical protein